MQFLAISCAVTGRCRRLSADSLRQHPRLTESSNRCETARSCLTCLAQLCGAHSKAFGCVAR
eukprot:9324125-Alexandrium_andersonii.AAC.1